MLSVKPISASPPPAYLLPVLNVEELLESVPVAIQPVSLGQPPGQEADAAAAKQDEENKGEELLHVAVAGAAGAVGEVTRLGGRV